MIRQDFLDIVAARLQAEPMRPMSDAEASDVRALFGTIESPVRRAA